MTGLCFLVDNKNPPFGRIFFNILDSRVDSLGLGVPNRT